jgi:sigma-B regulation protein RsbU (phosphoserine phosphatase)
MQGECETGTANGIALGVMDDAAYLESRIEFSDGDIVALFTDGITEAMSKDGELYGKERLSACIKRSKDRTAAGIIEDVLVDVKAFTKDAEQNDDITIVILKA